MPVNFNLLRQAGPANFAEGLMQGQDQQNALLQQQQQRQLSDIQLRNALRGEQEAMAESEAVKGSASLEDLAGRYRKAGLGRQALATEAALAKQRTDKLAAAKTQFELLKSSATRIMANPAAAVSELQRYQQLTGVDMSDDIAQIQQMPPDQVKAWASGHALEADKLLPKFQSMAVPGVGVQTGTTDYTGTFTPGRVFKEQMSEAQKAQNQIAQRQLAVSQGNLNVAQQRLAQESDPAFQQRMTNARTTGELIAKGDVAAIQALPKVIGDAEMAVGVLDQMVGKRDSATGKLLTKDPVTGKPITNNKPHPGFAPAVGMGGFGTLGIPGLAQITPGTDAANFKTLYDQITGAAFSEAFETLKGGGSITEKEGLKATAARNRMSLAQSEGEFVKAALEYRDILAKGVERAQSKAVKATNRMTPAAPASGGVIDFGSLK